MRKEIYLAIIEQIRSANCGIQHIGLWNEDQTTPEQAPGYTLPALLVEFGPLRWEQRGNGTKSAPALIRLHLITSLPAGSADTLPSPEEAAARYALCDAVVDALNGLAGEGFTRFQHVETVSGHKHEGRQCDVEAFACEVRDLRGANRKWHTTASRTEITLRPPADKNPTRQ